MTRVLPYYLARGWITEAQHRAGERFSSSLVAAQRWMDGRDPADRAAAEQARDALRKLGPLRAIAVDVCHRGTLASQWATTQGERPEAGIALLRVALDVLAAHYGFAAAEGEDAAREWAV